jgi:hypothetical protein
MRFEKGNKAAKGGNRKSKDDRPPVDEQQANNLPVDDLRVDEALFTTISNPKKRAFLAAFASCGHVVDAAKAAGISWTSHYNWLKAEDNAAYTEAFNRAREIAGDIAEGEIYRRGFLGYDHPVIHQGEITTTYKDYSDTLAIFWLKGLKPERYRENVNLSGNVGLPVDDFYNKIANRRRGETKS